MRLLTIVQRTLLLCVFCCCLLMALQSHAQERAGTKRITGKIITATGNRPIPDVVIFIQGTNINTSSDNNGGFTIDAKEGDVLVVSTIGYLQKQITVGKSNVFEV